MSDSRDERVTRVDQVWGGIHDDDLHSQAADAAIQRLREMWKGEPEEHVVADVETTIGYLRSFVTQYGRKGAT